MVRNEFQLVILFVIICFCVVCSCSAENIAITHSFDSEKAFDYLNRQVLFGPRIPGTAPHAETADWIFSILSEQTSDVSYQSFTGLSGGSETAMKNILASFYPEKNNRVLLCAHWDSRPHADRDPDRSKQLEPVPGANDGASGVAVLLVIAEILAKTEPVMGVDIVFFDGEDGGEYGSDESWLLGSRHFAKTMPPTYRPEYAILLDMIGDRDLSLSRDYYSTNSAPLLWRKIVMHCESLGIPVSGETIGILDDHVPLIERGIRAVDLIDFDYPYWHTVSDTPDKCSPESLGKIGKLLLKLLYEK
ncbi:M28 family peptidase [Candidatus Latescibacterota bacterium]